MTTYPTTERTGFGAPSPYLGRFLRGDEIVRAPSSDPSISLVTRKSQAAMHQVLGGGSWSGGGMRNRYIALELDRGNERFEDGDDCSLCCTSCREQVGSEALAVDAWIETYWI